MTDRSANRAACAISAPMLCLLAAGTCTCVSKASGAGPTPPALSGQREQTQRHPYVAPSPAVDHTGADVRHIYINRRTGEQILYLDGVCTPTGTEDQWTNLNSDPCGEGFQYLDISVPTPWLAFPEIERVSAVGMMGDVPYDTLVDEFQIAFTTRYTDAMDPDPSTPGITDGNRLVLSIMEGDDGFGDTLAQPLFTISTGDLPTSGQASQQLYIGTVDLGTYIEIGDTDGDPVTNDLYGNVEDPDSVIFNPMGGAAGDPSLLDRDPVVFGPGNGPGDGFVDFSVRAWFEQPGVVPGDTSTYGNVVTQGLLLAGPSFLDTTNSGDGFDDCGGMITGNFELPGSFVLYDLLDFYGFDGGRKGTAGPNPLAPNAANYDVSIWFGGSCCNPGFDPSDPVLERRPMAAFYFGMRGPVAFGYGSTPISCPPDINGDGSLNIDDVLSYINAFAAGDPVANFICETPAELNIDDVLAFLNAYAAGCP